MSAGAYRNIALIGMMGSGKSTVGRLLAERLGWRFIDTDDRIVRAAGKSIAEIFEQDGEEAFRNLESRIVKAAVEEHHAVLALGGGAILREENREAIWAESHVVWLTASPEEHFARVSKSERRPLLERQGDPVEAARRILKAREPLYALAHWKEETTGRTPEEVVEHLLEGRRWDFRPSPEGAASDDPLRPHCELIMSWPEREDTVKETVRVDLGERSYSVIVKPGLLAEIPERLPEATAARRLLLVSHPKLMDLYGNALADGLRAAGCTVAVASVPAGEKSKSLSMTARLYRDMAMAGLDRHGAVLALGGGVIGDLAGFAAATWLRGVDVVHVPTTLLAMVDSAIGGKTGVNLPIGKNLVGAFHQPRAVLSDPDVLASLPARDIRSGMAEVIKYGVIEDAALFAFLEKEMPRCLALEPEALARVISDSAACKARVVSADEREGGLRAILNYGHTAGHAIEKAAGYRRLRHGEAIGLGMIAAARIGQALGITHWVTVQRIERLVAAAGLPERIPAGITVETLLETVAFDKKAKGGSVKWVMAEMIGRVRTGVEVPADVAARVLRELGAE